MQLTQIVKEKLQKAFSPSLLLVTDNSPDHQAHLQTDGGVPTHIQIQIVSDQFANLSVLERHKKIYEILKSEILQLHAITIDAKATK
jgi:BolA protein